MINNYEYQVIDEKRDVKVLHFSNNLELALEYMTGIILSGLTTAKSLGIKFNKIDMSSFHIDVVKKTLYTRNKIDSYKIGNDYKFISESKKEVNHSENIMNNLSNIKIIINNKCIIKKENFKCNNNISNEVNINNNNNEENKKHSVSSLLEESLNLLKNKQNTENNIKKERYIPLKLSKNKNNNENNNESILNSDISENSDDLDDSNNSEDSNYLENSHNVEDFSDTESISSISTINEDEIDDPNKLLDIINALEDKKKNSESELKKIKNKINFDLENLKEYNYEKSYIKNNLNKEKEEQEIAKRIFESEKNYTYPKIKKDIEENRSSENNIPSIFLSKYSIYEYMDNNNLLEDDDAFDIFQSLYNKVIKSNKEKEDNTNNDEHEIYDEKKSDEFIPHNVHYLDEENKKKYLKKKQRTQPLEDILTELDNKEKELKEDNLQSSNDVDNNNNIDEDNINEYSNSNNNLDFSDNDSEQSPIEFLENNNNNENTE